MKGELLILSQQRLNNGLRESMLKIGAGKALMIVEAAHRLKLKPTSWYTFDQLHRLCRDNFKMSRQLVYEGLQYRLVFQRRKDEGVAGRRGARPYLYRIPFIGELIAEFAPYLKETPADELHSNDLRSLKSYRKGLHRELYIRKWLENGGRGFKMYRALMAERLGVSVRTIRTYDKELKFSSEANYKETQVRWDTWQSLPRYKDRYNPDGTKQPRKRWLRAVKWEADDVRHYPLVRYLAFRALAEKYDVYVVEREANTYYPYQKPDLSRFDGSQVLAMMDAERAARNAANIYQANDGKWFYQRE